MPKRPPLRYCVDCGRAVRYSWRELVKCARGRGCRAGEQPPPPAPADTSTEIPY